VELARALVAGDDGAFDRFAAHFRAKIFHYSWLMCGSREDAEEVAQETLLKVFAKVRQLREPERVRPWVFRIAKNACLMQRRKSVFAPPQELSIDELPPGFEAADAEPAPESQMLRAELRAVLDRVIAGLPPSYRAVILLRDVEGLSTEDTAQILDVSGDVVKTRLHRGRVAMREQLDCYVRNHCLEDEAAPDVRPLSAQERAALFAVYTHDAEREPSPGAGK